MPKVFFFSSLFYLSVSYKQVLKSFYTDCPHSLISQGHCNVSTFNRRKCSNDQSCVKTKGTDLEETHMMDCKAIRWQSGTNYYHSFRLWDFCKIRCSTLSYYASKTYAGKVDTQKTFLVHNLIDDGQWKLPNLPNKTEDNWINLASSLGFVNIKYMESDLHEVNWLERECTFVFRSANYRVQDPLLLPWEVKTPGYQNWGKLFYLIQEL